MSAVIKKTFVLPQLGCPNCAAKIEAAIGKLEGVTDAAVLYAAKRLIVEADEGQSDALHLKIQTIVNGIEPGVVVVDITDGGDSREDKQSQDIKIKGIQLAVSGFLFVAALILSRLGLPAVAVPLYLASYLLTGYTVLLSAARGILSGRVFNENFLISLATLGAFTIGFFDEGAAVMLFYQTGMFLQNLSAGRSRRSITKLMDIRPDTARLIVEGESHILPPSAVQAGDTIQVLPGEKIPLDGIVTQGVSMADTSALTGESMPREVAPGSEVLAGFVNLNGLLTMRVMKEFSQSTVARILEMMQNAGAKKAPTENFITAFARYYTPAVTVAACLTAVIPPLFLGLPWADWLYRALVFLVISCPCALVLSIPLGFFAGIGAASHRGVLIKGGNYLEALQNSQIMVFDKTGTLTKGVFEVTQLNPSGGLTRDELLRFAAAAGTHSTHPIAVSIRKACEAQADPQAVSDYQEMAGFGTKASVEGKTVLAGSFNLMRREGINCTPYKTTGSAVYVAVDGRFAGVIVISDSVKPDAAETVNVLRKLGVKPVMLTGDSRAVAESAAEKLGIDAVYYELLPDQKVSVVESLLKEKTGKGKLVFVGDGVNDAPALARADVGVAMGRLGSDAAIESADVVLMTDEPQRLLDAMAISRKTKRVVWQNIVFSLGVKAAVLFLGALGWASMWAAVFADVGVSLLAVLNALRILRVKPIKAAGE